MEKIFVPHKFTKVALKGIQGEMVGFESPDGQFNLRAVKTGLELSGTFAIETEDDLQDFARLIAEAWSERRRLSGKIVRSSGL